MPSKLCAMCGKEFDRPRAKYCTIRCANKAKRIALYGLTPEIWRELTKDGMCNMCKQPFGRRKIHVDHDHKSKRPRGIVCASCNHALRYLKNNPTTAFLAGEYLLNPPVSLLDKDGTIMVKSQIVKRDKSRIRRFSRNGY